MSKKILVAESSSLVKSFFTTILESEGYEVIFASDGFEAIREIKHLHPDCLLCSTDLAVLNGFEVSKIIKNRDNLNLPVVLYTISDELYPDTYIYNSLCDKFFNFDVDFPDEVIDNISNVIKDFSGKKKGSQSGKKGKKGEDFTAAAIRDVTGFYQNQNEYLNIINAIFKIYEIATLPKEAAVCILDVLINFVNYDIVSFSICNGDLVHDFCRVKSYFSPEEIHDFITVSHDKFLQNCSSDVQMKFLDTVYNLDGSMPETRSGSSNRIKAIESATLFCETYVGTITVGSMNADTYTEDVSKKFQYFAEKVSPFAMNLMTQYKLRTNYKNLRKAFSSFVPEEIIDDLVDKANNQTETAGEKRQIAVLICDIRSFTNISEKNKAEDVVSFLNGYFTEMVEIIKNHGGSIDKFMGDAIMAMFGAPISYEDNAQRAVEAAIEMIEKLPEIDSSKLVLPDGYDKISIGIGIHYGEVILGSIGCEDKKDYTVIGDSVNLASRMEGLTKLYGTHILISESVRQELNSSVQIHKLDKVAVKGKKIPVWIYSVEDNKDRLSSDYYDSYDKAMDLYEVGAWALATEYFTKALQVAPESKAARLMLERCQNYIINPPENWDGAVVLTSK